MRILIVNHYSGSPKQGMEYRHFYIAKEFQRLGHEVCIVSSSFSHLRSCQPLCISSKTQMTSHHGVPHIWLRGCEYKNNGLKRLINMFGFAASLWLCYNEIIRLYSPDIVYASSPHPLVSYGAFRLARKACAKFIFEIRDLWPLSLIELAGLSKWNPLVLVLNHAESYGCQHADHVISLLPKADDYLISLRHVSRAKLQVIPNGVSPTDWLDEEQPCQGEIAEYFQTVHAHRDLVVGYTGSHGLPNALDYLLDAAKLLKDKPISFVLVGDGHEKVRLQRRVTEEGLTKVHMFGPIAKAQIPALLREFDIAYIGWQRAAIYRFGIAPNKLMDYMMAGKVILHSVEAGNNPVEEAACGLTVPPESPHGIAEGLLKLCSLTAIERAAMGLRGCAYVRAHHTYPVLAKKLLSIIEGQRTDGHQKKQIR